MTMKYMGSYYATLSDFDLNTLWSKKKNRITKLEREAGTYLNMQERKKLREQMMWIQAELNLRADQRRLF